MVEGGWEVVFFDGRVAHARWAYRDHVLCSVYYVIGNLQLSEVEVDSCCIYS